MQVHNPSNLPTIDYTTVQELQGDLKDLTKVNYEKLKNVLNKRGFTTPLFIWFDQDTPYLLDGHQRSRVMRGEDMQPYEVPYVEIKAKDRLDAKAQLLEISSQYGHITQEGFDEFAVDLPEAEIIEAISFDALPFLGDQPEPEVEQDDEPEPDTTEPPKSKLGELYILGEHRLLVGDCTKAEQVRILMNGAKAQLFATDPPYLVDYDGTNHPHKWGQKEPKTKNKDWSDSYKDWDSHKTKEEDNQLYTNFCKVAIEEALLPNAAWYCWHAGTRAELVIDAWRDNGVLLHQQIIWVKDRPVLTRSYYMYQHEPCYYGWLKGNMPPKLKGDNPRSVWNIPTLPPGQHNDHPTSKPVDLFARSIVQHTQPGDVLYEPFAGSGSQMVAAQQLGRKCYMMELEPTYVDVIRKRYWKLVNDGVEDGWEENTSAIISEATTS